MTSQRSSNDIFKAAHKLDKYLMKGDKSHTKPQPARKPTPTRDADDIEDPLSMPTVGDNTPNSDDDVIITNTKRSNNDTLSKFTKFKRKTPTSAGSLMAKKPKITPSDQLDEDIEIEQVTKSKESKSKSITSTSTSSTPAPRQPKKVSAAAMLEDDDDDDVLNFTALQGIIKPKPKSVSESKTKIDSEKSTETKPKPKPTPTKSSTPSTSSTPKKATPQSTKNKIVPIVDLDDDFIESDSEGKHTPRKKGKSSNNKEVDIISLIKGTASTALTVNRSHTEEPKKPRTPLASKFTKPKTPVEMLGNPNADLLAEKYEPTTEQELAVQPKKIAEVRKWIRDTLDSLQANVKYAPRMLVLTGPCGAGKTALLRVLAKEVNCEICEWITPPVTVKKNSEDSLTVPYMPRLQEFQKWLRFAGLSQGLFAAANKILLIEDMPFLADVAKTDEFRETIREFLRTTRYPLVFILSDTYMGNSAVNTILSHDILESPMVSHIGVNAVTAPKAKKAIERIVRGENLEITPSQIESIIHDNEGDVRAIINSLQFFCVGREPKEKPKKGKAKAKEKQEKPKEKESVQTFLGCRDISLSLFHALGKILYNKRLPETDPNADIESSLYRPPMENVPEQVIERVHVEPSMFNMFLHQNYPDFFTDVDDISEALLYLSDADRLAKPWEDSATFGPFVASVAARGFQYAQTHEFERKFLPLKKPQLIETMRTRDSNCQAAYDIMKKEVYNFNAQIPRGDQEMPAICIAPSNVLLTEILPFMHKILSPFVSNFRDSAVMTKFFPAKNSPSSLPPTPSPSSNNFNNNNNNNNNNYNNNNNSSNNNFYRNNFNNTNNNNSNNNNNNNSNSTNNNNFYRNNFNYNTQNNNPNRTTLNFTNNYKGNTQNNFNTQNTSFNNKNNNIPNNHFTNILNKSNTNSSNQSSQISQHTQNTTALQLPPTTPADYESFISGPSYNLLTSLCTYTQNPGTLWDRASKLETWFIPEDEEGQQQQDAEVEKLADDIEEF
eukprot:Phypoly_transcript_01166.p1 GENE.Phypoly_transcript_01166~~Phypoly_transcript_01166.p1  ORF type:complete len:1007 (+),score=264.12 Phypoly_transcript_01166:548-3568(+)